MKTKDSLIIDAYCNVLLRKVPSTSEVKREFDLIVEVGAYDWLIEGVKAVTTNDIHELLKTRECEHCHEGKSYLCQNLIFTEHLK
jgi:hypothetical protein